MTMNNNPIYAEAFRQMSLGRSVMPVRKDKRPYVPQWKSLQITPADEVQLEKWWDKTPDANLGIITGKLSNLIVIDIDTYAGATDVFPDTYTVQTGNGGLQKYYLYTEGFTISANGYPAYPHVDIRSTGGYVVCPPSVTSYIKDGKQAGGLYTVLKDIPLAPFPAHMFAPLGKKKNKLTDTIGAGQGKRNDSLASTVGALLLAHSENEWDSVVLPAVEKIAATMNPPLPLSEVRATFKSIVSREHSRRVESSGGDMNDEEEALRTAFVKNKASGTFALAQFIVRRFDIITIGEAEYEPFVYKDGMYRPAFKEVIGPEIQRILGPLVTNSAQIETLHKIYNMTTKPRSIFTSASLDFIPLLNGVYDRKNKVLLPHSPDYRFTYQFPITYDPAATCPKTSAFLDQILLPEQRTVVEEWIGYYFLRNYMFKKAIIFVGEGDTGKTTLLETIDFLLGKSNISSVSLQKMTSDKFAAAHMFEKHGNLVDELSAKDISDTGNFKIATGGGSISGEYKFGNQFSFHNFSKLTFACNRIPDVKDFNDEAYFNRWMVIRFEHTIEKKIPNFIKTLTTDEERSGLFNLVMQGLDRLLEQGHFSYGKNAGDTKKEMLRSGSSIAMFAAEKLMHSLGNELSKEDMYDAYTAFCQANDMPAETIKMLGTRLTLYVPYMSDGTMTTFGSKRVRGWRNVAIIPDDVAATLADDEFEKL